MLLDARVERRQLGEGRAVLRELQAAHVFVAGEEAAGVMVRCQEKI